LYFCSPQIWAKTKDFKHLNSAGQVNTLSYKTVSANKQTVTRKWYLVDAEDAILGRMASRIAMILRGKHKPSFTPHVDCGDYVVVVNAAKARLTGKKWSDRVHFSHSGYPGGQKLTTPAQLRAKHPERLIEYAVRRMLPKNKLGDKIYKKLRVSAGLEHEYEAQKPEKIDLNTIK